MRKRSSIGDSIEDSPLPVTKMGRPSKRDIPVERETILLNALRMGLSYEKACALVEIDPPTFRRWRQNDEVLSNKVEAARATAIHNLLSEAWDIAKNAGSEAVRLKAIMYLLSVLDPGGYSNKGISDSAEFKGSEEIGSDEVNFEYC